MRRISDILGTKENPASLEKLQIVVKDEPEIYNVVGKVV